MKLPWLSPIRLTGAYAGLEPLDPGHEDELAAALNDGELWNLWYAKIPSPATLKAEIARRLGLQQAGSMVPFVSRDAEGRVVGMTTYMNIDAENQRVEIGATWTARHAQRSPVNTQCKLLLLAHAFERGAIAVEFRTHFLNQQSRRAIERLGARLDGVLRNHQRLANGTLRDTCVYSITQEEWPAVRTHLQWQLDKPRT